MKVLIDTNVILDVLCKRNGFYEDAVKIMRYCEINKITGVISALTIPNIVYIMRKERDAQSASALRVKADYIITRNIKDFTSSRVPAIKPKELLDRI